MKLLLPLFIGLVGVVNMPGQSLPVHPAPTASSLVETQHLEMGKFIERKLKTGAIQRYTARLDKGQLLKAIVNQRGIDAVVTDLRPRQDQTD